MSFAWDFGKRYTGPMRKPSSCVSEELNRADAALRESRGAGEEPGAVAGKAGVAGGAAGVPGGTRRIGRPGRRARQEVASRAPDAHGPGTPRAVASASRGRESNGQRPTLAGVCLYRMLACPVRKRGGKAQGLRLPADVYALPGPGQWLARRDFGASPLGSGGVAIGAVAPLRADRAVVSGPRGRADRPGLGTIAHIGRSMSRIGSSIAS